MTEVGFISFELGCIFGLLFVWYLMWLRRTR